MWGITYNIHIKLQKTPLVDFKISLSFFRFVRTVWIIMKVWCSQFYIPAIWYNPVKSLNHLHVIEAVNYLLLCVMIFFLSHIGLWYMGERRQNQSWTSRTELELYWDGKGVWYSRAFLTDNCVYANNVRKTRGYWVRYVIVL